MTVGSIVALCASVVLLFLGLMIVVEVNSRFQEVCTENRMGGWKFLAFCLLIFCFGGGLYTLVDPARLVIAEPPIAATVTIYSAGILLTWIFNFLLLWGVMILSRQKFKVAKLAGEAIVPTSGLFLYFVVWSLTHAV